MNAKQRAKLMANRQVSIEFCKFLNDSFLYKIIYPRTFIKLR
jgi:hypothetical protein